MKSEAIADNLRRSNASPECFGAFYRHHIEQLHCYFVRRIYDHDLAFDLAAETFAQAYVARKRFRGRTDREAAGWLYGIASRQLALFFRRNRVEQRALMRLGIEVPPLDDEERLRLEDLAGLNELRLSVREGLGELSEAQRRAVELRVVEELPYREVASRLQISEGAARVRVTRALRALAVSLGPNRIAEENL